MRIAIVSDYVDPSNWGGAARVAAEQAIALKKLGHEVSLIAASGSHTKLPGIEHVTWIRKSGFLSYWKLKKNIFKAVKAFRPELIILHQPLSGTMIQRLFKNIETRYFFHSSWVDEVRSQGKTLGLKKRASLEREALQHSSKVFVTSPFTQSVLNRVCPGLEDKTVENPLAVNSPPFQPNISARALICEKHHINESRKVLTSFRRLTARTGIDLLLKAISQINNVTLLLGGTGEQEQQLKTLTAQLGIEDRVIFLGYIEEAEMLQTLQGSDLAVVPSKELEGFGLFTIEALACGCPVAATPAGNNRNLLESAGFPEMVCAEITEESLCQAITDLLTKDHDKETLSRSVLNKFSWQKHVEALIS